MLQALLPYVAPIVASYARKQVFGSGGSKAQGQVNSERSRLSGYRDTYDNLTSQYLADMGESRQRYNAAAGDYESYLKNPYATSADDTAQLDSAQAAGVAAGERAKASIGASMARRGLTDSSASIGAETAIESAQAAQRARGASDLAMEQIRQRDARKRQLVAFLADRLARSQGGLGAAMSGSQRITGQLLGQYGDDLSFERQGQAQQDADFGALAAQIGQLLATKGSK